MTDEQLQEKLRIRRILIISAIFILISVALAYYRISTDSVIRKYKGDQGQAETLQTQIDTLTDQVSQLQSSIEQNGKELVSFTEDKIKYINLASSLSNQFNVRLSKLSVSDVWTEGQMAGMTTDIEIEGSLANIRSFVEEYCGSKYTNRINEISCRPIDRYPWLARTIDGERVLSWFDLTDETKAYEDHLAESELPDESNRFEAGVAVAPSGSELGESQYITLDDMFAAKTMRVYLQIDFLGRE